ncbi:fertilization-influencing membrane protein isoform X1 [Prionailurus iriomotensis]
MELAATHKCTSSSSQLPVLSPLNPEFLIRMAPGCDITEPPPLSQEERSHEAVAVGLGVGVAAGAGGHRNRPDFFDYPDSDQARLLAVARFIGEKPVIFVNSGMNQLETASFLAGVWRRAALGYNSEFFYHILVGALVVAFLFLLFQFCTHM